MGGSGGIRKRSSILAMNISNDVDSLSRCLSPCQLQIYEYTKEMNA